MATARTVGGTDFAGGIESASGNATHMALKALRPSASSAEVRADVEVRKAKSAAEIAAMIRAMLLRESLYAPRIFAHLYPIRFIQQPFHRRL